MTDRQKRDLEVQKLNSELMKIHQQVILMGSEERSAHIENFKKGLEAMGILLSPGDEIVFVSFIKGECQLDDLTRHFGDRIVL